MFVLNLGGPGFNSQYHQKKKMWFCPIIFSLAISSLDVMTMYLMSTAMAL